MGLFVSRPQKESNIGAPFRNPFTDITAGIGLYDSGPCLPFQLRFVDCMEAYGAVQGKEKCNLLYQDFCECSTQWKQLKRVQDIRNERMRQWALGVAGKGEEKKLFEEAPPVDSYKPGVQFEKFER